MEQETVKFAWRTPKGEQNKMKSERNINNKKNVLRYCCNWYYCADEGMETELVLCYAIYEVKYGNNISCWRSRFYSHS